MKHTATTSLTLATILLAGSVQAAESSEDFERFLSYPYMERAYKAADNEDWNEAESLTRFLLERVPGEEQARRLLIQALAAQDRYPEALEQAQKLSDSAENRQLQHQLRMHLMTTTRPTDQTVNAWLADSQDPERRQIWQAFSLQLQEHRGADAALRWLGTVQSTEAHATRRWRAAMAEEADRSLIVIESLQPVQQAGALSDTDWDRLAIAYTKTRDVSGIDALLESAPSAAAERRLRKMAAERFIAADQPELALQWLQPIADEPNLQQSDLGMLLELARQAEKPAMVEQLADRLDRPCLETVEWLSSRDEQSARAQLATCDRAQDPHRWMVLALRLDAVDLLADRPLPGKWERVRRSQLVDYWRAKGNESRALAWVQNLPPDNHTRRLRAELMESAGRPGAAEAWLAYYAHAGDPYGLEQATYLLMQQGSEQQAQDIIETELKSHPDRLSEVALERLATLYAQEDSVLDSGAIEPLLQRVDDRMKAGLLVRLADADRCKLVREYAPQIDRQADDYLALARCAEQAQPGTAAIYYRRAIEQGAQGVEKNLAYTLFAAGDSAAATEIWLKQDIAELDQTDLLAASRSALQAEQVDAARQFWSRTRGESTERYRLGAAIALASGDSETALELDRQALALDPQARHYYAASVSALAADEQKTSLQWLAESVQRDPDHPVYRVEYGLRLAASEEREKRLDAIPYLEMGAEDYPEDLDVVEALGYRYAEAGAAEAAQVWLRKAIDLSGEELFFEQDNPERLVQRQYDQRRTHEVLGREDSFTVASVWSPNAVLGTLGQPASGQNYQIATWDHLLNRNRYGQALAVYGRILTSGAERTSYFDTLGAGVGLRFKPFQQYNLNLYSELYNESSLEGEDDRGLDLLLRASASFLDQGEYRNEWRPVEEHWFERLLFLDAAWFVAESEKQFTARYHHGYAFRLPLGSAQTLMPYLTGQATALDEEQDFRAGLGLRWQYWFDDSLYNAYAKRATFRTEYQTGVGGNLYDEGDGWLFGLELAW